MTGVVSTTTSKLHASRSCTVRAPGYGSGAPRMWRLAQASASGKTADLEDVEWGDVGGTQCQLLLQHDVVIGLQQLLVVHHLEQECLTHTGKYQYKSPFGGSNSKGDQVILCRRRGAFFKGSPASVTALRTAVRYARRVKRLSRVRTYNAQVSDSPWSAQSACAGPRQRATASCPPGPSHRTAATHTLFSTCAKTPI